MSAPQNLIFIHGFRGNNLGLKELASYFDSTKYRVYLPQLPPAGGLSLAHYTPDSYADFLANYIKSHHIKSPILIGHSMGSIITAATAAKYPALLGEKLIFLSPISVKTSPFFASLTPLVAFLPNRLIGYISTKYMFVPHNKPLLQKTLKTTYLCGADYTSRKDLFKSAQFSTKYSISDFDFSEKSCFISGEKDKLMPLSATRDLAAKHHAPLIVIPGTGHLLNYENPSAVAKAVKDFLASSKT